MIIYNKKKKKYRYNLLVFDGVDVSVIHFLTESVFKEKDYEFTNKSRKIPMVQTSDNPLKADRPRIQVQRGRTKNVQVRTTGNFVDPLSR